MLLPAGETEVKCDGCEHLFPVHVPAAALSSHKWERRNQQKVEKPRGAATPALEAYRAFMKLEVPHVKRADATLSQQAAWSRASQNWHTAPSNPKNAAAAAAPAAAPAPAPAPARRAPATAPARRRKRKVGDDECGGCFARVPDDSWHRCVECGHRVHGLIVMCTKPSALIVQEDIKLCNTSCCDKYSKRKR